MDKAAFGRKPLLELVASKLQSWVPLRASELSLGGLWVVSGADGSETHSASGLFLGRT